MDPRQFLGATVLLRGRLGATLGGLAVVASMLTASGAFIAHWFLSDFPLALEYDLSGLEDRVRYARDGEVEFLKERGRLGDALPIERTKFAAVTLRAPGSDLLIVTTPPDLATGYARVIAGESYIMNAGLNGDMAARLRTGVPFPWLERPWESSRISVVSGDNLSISWAALSGSFAAWISLAWAAMFAVQAARYATRIASGRCGWCSYDLKGGVLDPCPECGRVLSPARHRSHLKYKR